MSIRRRETKAGVPYDVQWRGSQTVPSAMKTFGTERAAKQFEAKLVTSSATGEALAPKGRQDRAGIGIPNLDRIAPRPQR